MVLRSTPTSFIHSKSVEADSASGRPEEKPSSRMMRTRGSRNTAAARAQRSPMLGFGVVPPVAVIAFLIATAAAASCPHGGQPIPDACKSGMAGKPAMTAREVRALILAIARLDRAFQ